MTDNVFDLTLETYTKPIAHFCLNKLKKDAEMYKNRGRTLSHVRINEDQKDKKPIGFTHNFTVYQNTVHLHITCKYAGRKSSVSPNILERRIKKILATSLGSSFESRELDAKLNMKFSRQEKNKILRNLGYAGYRERRFDSFVQVWRKL